MAIEPTLLKIYYSKLFPFDTLFEWLKYEHKVEKGENPRSREFAFTLENDVFYKEYLTITNKETLKDNLFKKVPLKVDIGAEFDIPPTDTINRCNMPMFRKELVIDIDISDYDDVRTCCQRENICQKCWKYIVLACRILESIIQVEYAIKNTLWVFSGRRGIHCWVCDAEVRQFTTADRKDFVDFLFDLPELILKRWTKHPIDIRIMEMINGCFIEICMIDQQLLRTKQDVVKFVARLPDTSIRARFQEEMLKFESSQDRWNAFVSLYEQLKQTNGLKGDMKHNFVDYMKTLYVFPRLDVNVTKSDTHLLKAPFCVHPNTGKICVPLNPQHVDTFNVDNVPTINKIFEQIEKYNKENNSTSLDARKTDLLQWLEVFEAFVDKLKRSN